MAEPARTAQREPAHWPDPTRTEPTRCHPVVGLALGPRPCFVCNWAWAPSCPWPRRCSMTRGGFRILSYRSCD
eukprot:5330184-Alexandrium_andersonii.AAC.1